MLEFWDADRSSLPLRQHGQNLPANGLEDPLGLPRTLNVDRYLAASGGAGPDSGISPESGNRPV